MVVMDKHELYALRLDSDADTVLQTLLRSYTGLFSDYVYISESVVGRSAGLTDHAVYEALLSLRRAGAISYVPRTTTPFLIYPTSRELPRYIELPRAVYEDQKTRMEARIEAMKRFVFDAARCRVATMLDYFGESGAAPCGKCDVCRSRSSTLPDPDAVASAIERAIKAPGPHTPASLAPRIGVSPAVAAEAARLLIDRGRAALTPAGTIVAI